MGKAPHITTGWSEVESAHSLQSQSLVTCFYQWGPTFHKTVLPAREQASKPWACGDIPIQVVTQAEVLQFCGANSKGREEGLKPSFLQSTRKPRSPLATCTDLTRFWNSHSSKMLQVPWAKVKETRQQPSIVTVAFLLGRQQIGGCLEQGLTRTWKLVYSGYGQMVFWLYFFQPIKNMVSDDF